MTMKYFDHVIFFFLIFLYKNISGDTTPLPKREVPLQALGSLFFFRAPQWSLTVATPLGMSKAKLRVRL